MSTVIPIDLKIGKKYLSGVYISVLFTLDKKWWLNKNYFLLR